ncbi:MAG: 50S ribosomal protein L15 [Bacteroidales bacterium]|nr:50S ribosomal protein L15 [Bacteroidales bacterium]
MDLSNLKPAAGSVKTSKRLGRGQGSGRGGTSTRGHKGAQSRSGYSRKIGFEGGQMPLYRRVPKSGFKNINRVEYSGINIDVLSKLAESKGITVVTPLVLQENGLLGKGDLLKILGRGELKAKLDITAHAFSAKAVQAIESVGGTATKIER